jgi:hypothetical protein
MSRSRQIGFSNSRRGFILVLLSFLFLLPCQSSAACFTPNGTNINAYNGYDDGAIYAPCNSDPTAVSMCCAIGPNRGSKDECFKDGSGLCTNTNVGPGAHFWRESCTDVTWRDPACVKLFINGTGKYHVQRANAVVSPQCAPYRNGTKCNC